MRAVNQRVWRVMAMIATLLLSPGVVVAEGDTLGSTGPQPVTQPIVPTSGDGAQLAPEERMLRDIDTRIRGLDLAIRDVLVRYPGGLPVIDTRFLTGLDLLRDQRDLAWADVRRVLTEGPDGIIRDAPDILDTPPGEGRDRDMRRFRARALLGIAECHRELYVGSNGLEGDLQLGEQRLVAVTVTDLETIEQPRYRFLRVWFAIERARTTDDRDARDAAIAEAQRYVREFRDGHPDSVTLIAQAEQLVAGLELDMAVERARNGAGGS